MGQGIRSKTECTCNQEMEGQGHTSPSCPYYIMNYKDGWIALKKHLYGMINVYNNIAKENCSLSNEMFIKSETIRDIIGSMNFAEDDIRE
jgi:hypothetical protein